MNGAKGQPQQSAVLKLRETPAGPGDSALFPPFPDPPQAGALSLPGLFPLPGNDIAKGGGGDYSSPQEVTGNGTINRTKALELG